MKPLYSIDAPDQQRLKIARIKIESVLAEHDLAGVCVLHTPGMSEFFYRINTSYSVCWVDESVPMVRIKSKLDRDHDGDLARQKHDQVATANMTAALAVEIGNAALMFLSVDEFVSAGLRAESGTGQFVPDPREDLPS